MSWSFRDQERDWLGCSAWFMFHWIWDWDPSALQMLSLDFRYFFTNHENLCCFSFVFAEQHESDIKAVTSGSTLDWTLTRKHQITHKSNLCISWRMAGWLFPSSPNRVLGQGHGAAYVCQMWSTKSLSINTPKTQWGQFYSSMQNGLFSLNFKINNILAKQTELTFLLKAYIFSFLFQ